MRQKVDDLQIQIRGCHSNREAEYLYSLIEWVYHIYILTLSESLPDALQKFVRPVDDHEVENYFFGTRTLAEDVDVAEDEDADEDVAEDEDEDVAEDEDEDVADEDVAEDSSDYDSDESDDSDEDWDLGDIRASSKKVASSKVASSKKVASKKSKKNASEDTFENNRYYIKRLEQRDPKLFKYKSGESYARKCQASNNMQPLVVTRDIFK